MVRVDYGPERRGGAPVLIVGREEIEGIHLAVMEKIRGILEVRDATIELLRAEVGGNASEIEEAEGALQEQYARCERLEREIEKLKARAKARGVDLDEAA